MSLLSGKEAKTDNKKLTAIQEYLLCCNCLPSFKDCPILITENDDFKLKVIKSYLIIFGKLVLRKARYANIFRTVFANYFNVNQILFSL